MCAHTLVGICDNRIITQLPWQLYPCQETEYIQSDHKFLMQHWTLTWWPSKNWKFSNLKKKEKKRLNYFICAYMLVDLQVIWTLFHQTYHLVIKIKQRNHCKILQQKGEFCYIPSSMASCFHAVILKVRVSAWNTLNTTKRIIFNWVSDVCRCQERQWRWQKSITKNQVSQIYH